MLDAYNRHARLAPAVLTLLPLTGLLALLGFSLSSLSSAVPAIIGAALHVLASHYVRDLGHAKEKALWRGWDGAPTTHMLRWREATNTPSLEQRHQDVARATGRQLPTPEEERRDPRAADQRYEAAATRIREAARGEGFEFVTTQNAAYGFRRNMYGCRTWAMRSSAAAIIGAAVCSLLGATAWPTTIVFSFAVILWAVALHLTINAGFVHTAAYRYAEALLGAVHKLQ